MIGVSSISYSLSIYIVLNSDLGNKILKSRSFVSAFKAFYIDKNLDKDYRRIIFKNTHQKSSAKKDVLKNFVNSTGKHLWTRPEDLQLYKKETPTLVFSCEICEFFKNTHFEKHLATTASAFCTFANSLQWNFFVLFRYSWFRNK